MLTYQDCLGLCDLREDEIEAIAEHEHLTDMAALELGQYLCETPDGERRIREIIVEDIRNAETTGNLEHALKLKLALRHFIQTHLQHSSR